LGSTTLYTLTPANAAALGIQDGNIYKFQWFHTQRKVACSHHTLTTTLLPVCNALNNGALCGIQPDPVQYPCMQRACDFNLCVLQPNPNKAGALCGTQPADNCSEAVCITGNCTVQPNNNVEGNPCGTQPNPNTDPCSQSVCRSGNCTLEANSTKQNTLCLTQPNDTCSYQICQGRSCLVLPNPVLNYTFCGAINTNSGNCSGMICIGGICNNGIMPVNSTCKPSPDHWHTNCFNYSCNFNGVCFNLCGDVEGGDAALIGGVVGGLLGGLCILIIIAAIIAFFVFKKVMPSEPAGFSQLGAGMTNDNPLYAGDLAHTNVLYDPHDYHQIHDL